MRKIVFIMMMLTTSWSYGQVQDTFPWCPPGAKWVYDGWRYAEHYFRSLNIIAYEGDVMIQGKLCKRFNVYYWHEVNNSIDSTNYYDSYSVFSGLKGPFFLYNQNDTIFYWNAFVNYGAVDSILGDSVFKMAYCFNANVGDSVRIDAVPIIPCIFHEYKVSNQSHSCFVDSVYYQNLNGFMYRTIRMTEGPYWTAGKNIIRNIGPTNAFLPGPYHDILGNDPTYDNGNCDYQRMMNSAHANFGYRHLLCYYDPLRGPISFNDPYDPINNTFNCDSTTYKQKRSNYLFENQAEVLIAYPNPVHKVLFIKGQDFQLEDAVIDLYNVNGQCISKEQYDVKDWVLIKELDIEQIPTGIYFVHVTKKDGKTKVIRFIKE